MRIGRLAELYDRVVASSRRGDVAAAHAVYLAIVGLRARRHATAVPERPARRTAAVLDFSTPRKVDLIALARGARRVAKFEDLTADAAEALAARLRARRLRTVIAGPYEKRLDVAVAVPRGGAPLFAVVASWGSEADEVVEAERDRSAAGTRRAGLALGYPPCCVEHFSALERGVAAHEDGINEAAIRSPAGLRDRAIPWEMNPLSAHAPVGFTPCSVACPAALAFARRVLAAVRAESERSYAIAERTLRRPILFFRYPLFHVLVPASADAPDQPVRYREAVAAAEPGIPVELTAWHEDEVGSQLAAGDGVRLADGALEIRQGETPVARWSLEDPGVPLLLRFSDVP